MSGKRKKAKTKPEFSKFILAVSALECWIVTGAALVMAWIGKDTSVFCYLIPSSWGAYGISRAFYYNKAKSENAIKLRKAYQAAGLDSAPADQEFESAMSEEIQNQTY